MTFLCTASSTSKAGTMVPAGATSISSRPPDIAFTRSAQNLKFSKDHAGGGKARLEAQLLRGLGFDGRRKEGSEYGKTGRQGGTW